MRLPKVLQPIKDHTIRAARHVLRQPPREPTLEEFVSPLREALKTELAVKQDVGYNPNCPYCKGHMTVDGRIDAAVAEREDPDPWLAQLHDELIKTRRDLGVTRVELEKSKSYYTPMNRLKWAAYGAVGTGIVSIFMMASKYAAEWAFLNLPWLVHIFL